MVVGCLTGWLLPYLVYPWDTVRISSLEPEDVGHLFQFFGVCLGGPVGFFVGTWLSLRYWPDKPPPTVPLPPVDPHKVEDNLG
jgi:hypothetical protein